MILAARVEIQDAQVFADGPVGQGGVGENGRLPNGLDDRVVGFVPADRDGFMGDVGHGHDHLVDDRLARCQVFFQILDLRGDPAHLDDDGVGIVPAALHLGDLVGYDVAFAAQLLHFEQDGFPPGVTGLEGCPIDAGTPVLHGILNGLQIFSDKLDFQHFCPYIPKLRLNRLYTGLQVAVTARVGVVNGATDERRTPKVKPAEPLSQVIRLVNDD